MFAWFNQTTISTTAEEEEETDDGWPKTTSGVTGTSMGYESPGDADFGLEFIISAYALIFLLALVGNLLVILTLVKNRSMRTVTNVLLLNLSIADLFIAILCMPSTLAQYIVQNYIFGTFPCKTLFYIQAVMICVSAFTLMTVSLERYFAICRPLHSRKWQTVTHAYKVIAGMWLMSAVFMSPLVIVHRVVSVENGDKFKCVDVWGRDFQAKVLRITFALFLDFLLLVLPVGVMCVAYGSIIRTLYQQMHYEPQAAQLFGLLPTTATTMHRCYLLRSSPPRDNLSSRQTSSTSLGGGPSTRSFAYLFHPTRSRKHVFASPDQNSPGQIIPGAGTLESVGSPSEPGTPGGYVNQHCMRVYNGRSLHNKRKIVCMLIVIVIEFFACWTPALVVQTWEALDRESARMSISARQFSVVVLMGYISTMCNPITYGFLNRRFRFAFASMFTSMFSCLGDSTRARLRRGFHEAGSSVRHNSTASRPLSSHGSLHFAMSYSVMPANVRANMLPNRYLDYSTQDPTAWAFA